MQGIMESADLIRLKYEINRKAKHYDLRGQTDVSRMGNVVLNSNQLTQLTVDVL